MHCGPQCRRIDDNAADDVADALTSAALDSMALAAKAAEAELDEAIAANDAPAIAAATQRLQELQGAPEGFKYCHCKAQAPPPPGGGAAAWICRKDDSAANGYHKWNTHPRSRAACNLADTVRIPPATATSVRNLNPVRSSTASRGSRGCRRKC